MQSRKTMLYIKTSVHSADELVDLNKATTGFFASGRATGKAEE